MLVALRYGLEMGDQISTSGRERKKISVIRIHLLAEKRLVHYTIQKHAAMQPARNRETVKPKTNPPYKWQGYNGQPKSKYAFVLEVYFGLRRKISFVGCNVFVATKVNLYLDCEFSF